jgi:hypothetical protein
MRKSGASLNEFDDCIMKEKKVHEFTTFCEKVAGSRFSFGGEF